MLYEKNSGFTNGGKVSLKTLLTGNNRKRWVVGVAVFGLLFGVSLVIATPATLRIQIDGVSPYYLPEAVRVSVGTIIWWENPTATHHTITHDGCKNGGNCAFDSGAIAPKGKFGLYSLAPGRYSYHCTLHPIMRGVVVVQDDSLLQKT
jgi:plastocyanin